MTSLIGQTLGQYQIIAQLGHGGMATVYKAYHPRLDRYVAVKVVHPMFTQDESFLARFEREAQIAARLDHPHIVPIYDFAEYQGQPYLVMKFIEGTTLKSVLADRALPLADILKLMPPIADALDYAHRQGVLHRDIKPSNIIIDTAGVPYLTDFGLARMVKSGESSLSHDLLLGTPHYISPEQAQGRADITARADQYSLGVVLYELITGQVPFSADTPLAVVHSHIHTPPPPPSAINPAIPPAVDAVLMRALAKDPEARFESASAMVSAFSAAVRECRYKHDQRRARGDARRDARLSWRRPAHHPNAAASGRGAVRFGKCRRGAPADGRELPRRY
jgi:serine/threonine protein kinase